MEAIIRLGASLGIFFIMISWEYFRPRRKLHYTRLKRWPINLGLAAVNIAVIRLTVGAIAYQAAVSASGQSWGLLNLLDTPNWVSIIVTLLFLDFAIYLQHIVFHKWKFLWRLHQVHHTDLDFDASTAVRFHPLEIMISMVYKVFFIYLIGADPAAVIAFEIILNGCATFNHSNVYIPHSIDKKLRWILITPDMHRIHQSVIPSETDSNYGFSVSCWDRICRTYTKNPKKSQTTMDIGLTPFRQQNKLGFGQLLLLPFKALRGR